MCVVCRRRDGGQGPRMLGMNRKRYKLWWSGKGDGVGGMGVMMQGCVCENAVKVRMVSDDYCCCF